MSNEASPRTIYDYRAGIERGRREERERIMAIVQKHIDYAEQAHKRVGATGPNTYKRSCDDILAALDED